MTTEAQLVFLVLVVVVLVVVAGVTLRRRSRRPVSRPDSSDSPSDTSFSVGPETAKGDGTRGASQEPSDVHVSTVVPESVRPSGRFLVEIVLHLEGYELQEDPGQVVGRDAAILSLREGARITVRLVPTPPEAFTLDEDEAEIVWKPPYRRSEFLLTAHRDLPDGSQYLRLELWSERVRLAWSYLEVWVDARAEPSARRRRNRISQALPRSAFASYSRHDRDRVLDRVASLETLGVDVFLDHLDLRQGARWETEIHREIRDRESFLLFWSRAASTSDWVEKEWRFALRHRGDDAILPNALEPPERCPPPPELAHLHFGSVVDRVRRDWSSPSR